MDTKYYKTEFVSESEIPKSQTQGIKHYRDSFDERGRLICHESINESGNIISRTKYEHFRGFTKELSSDGKRAYSFSQEKVIFDPSGNVVYPVQTSKTKPKLQILPTRSLNYDISSEKVHLILPRKNQMYHVENDFFQFLRKNKILVPVVHGPALDPTKEDFEYHLAHIRGKYGAEVVTIHPTKDPVFTVREHLEKIASDIEGIGINLSFENMDIPDTWLYNPQRINEIKLDNVSLTLDTSHLELGTDLGEVVDSVFDRISVVHLSNRTSNKKHLPFDKGELNTKAALQALKANGYKGIIVLDYMPEFLEQESEDIQKLKEFFS